jgi:phenylalanyl-tRNA synthetase beta chain
MLFANPLGKVSPQAIIFLSSSQLPIAHRRNLCVICPKFLKMKVSYNWLKQYIDFEWSPQDLAHRLTMAGLEVEGVERYDLHPGGLAGVVTGEVMTCAKHPGADKLSVTTVDVGTGELLHIVCGAPNVAAGQKVIVATVGAKLYPVEGEPFEIKKAKIRGEESCGMICAEDEIGLGHSHAGILILPAETPVGMPAAQYFKLESDYTLEIGLTPNRVDASSHYGVARDVAALLRKKAILPAIAPLPSELIPNPITVSLPEQDRCPRYVGIYIAGVTVAESPAWLQHRLKAIGARPINNVVDITNFVLHELGQPLHAFDADTIRGAAITVKTLEENAQFKTLDDQVRNIVAGEDLLICDAGGPVAIAGVMGGQNSEVSATTTNIFLESAYFEPAGVRRTGARLGMKTDASYRFERGIDPNITQLAALRAAYMIVELAGGKLSRLHDVGTQEFLPRQITFDLARANRLMGMNFSTDEVVEILSTLDILVAKAGSEDILQLAVPQYRVDVTRPQDVMEEILRLYGYNNVPMPAQNRMALNLKMDLDTHALRQKYFDYLAGNGWNELVTNPLVANKHRKETTANLINNLSEDLALMRDTMVLTGLDVIEYNHNRKNADLQLFELGKTYGYHAETGYHEKEWVAFFRTGNATQAHWAGKAVKAGFYTMGREMERMAAWFGAQLDRREIEGHAVFEYGLELFRGEKVVARYGSVAASLLQGRDIKGEVFYAEIDWEQLIRQYRKAKVAYQPLSKFPAVHRDISAIVPENVRFATVSAAIRGTNPKLIKEVTITDVYKGDSIGAGKKSYLLNLTILDETKTLQDEVVDKLMAKVFEKLEKDLNLEIRKN